MGKFQTANGINLHQKMFLATMKSCKFYQCSIQMQMFFRPLSVLMCDVDHRDKVNEKFVLI